MLADRLMTALVVVLILLAAGYCVYVGLSLRPSDLQVAVHYTAFGGTSFYRDKWYYLINFIAIGAIIGAAHTALIVKLYTQGRRQMALRSSRPMLESSRAAATTACCRPATWSAIRAIRGETTTPTPGRIRLGIW